MLDALHYGWGIVFFYWVNVILIIIVLNIYSILMFIWIIGKIKVKTEFS